MSGDGDDRLDPETAALFAEERGRPLPPPEVQARVLARLRASLLLPDPSGGSGGDSPVGGAPPAPLPPPGMAGGLAGGVAGLKAPLIVGIFAAGAVSGAVMHATLRPPVVERVVVEAHSPRTVSEPERITEPERSIEPERTTETEKATEPERRPEPRSAPSGIRIAEPKVRQPLQKVDSLDAERALIERARVALTRGAPEEALRTIARHTDEFPDGFLAEEREALRIQALVLGNQREEAQDRTAEFYLRFPKSLFLPAIERAMAQDR